MRGKRRGERGRDMREEEEGLRGERKGEVREEGE